MKYVPRPCAEFPNDNPGLHDGVVWVCAWSRARPRAVVRAPGVARQLVVAMPEALRPAPAAGAEREPDAPVLAVHAWSPKPPAVGAVAQADGGRDPFVEELEALIEDWESTPIPALATVEEVVAQAPRIQPLEPLALELTPLPPASSGWFDFTSRLSSWLLQRGATRAAALLSSLLEGNRVSLQRLSQAARERLLTQGMAELVDGDTLPSSRLLERARCFQQDFLAGTLDEPVAVGWLSCLFGGLLGVELDEQDVREALRRCGALGLLTRAA